ncbi:hypothetical protein C2857_005628 [Epichloe festucae Fl1]|uniref:Transcription factor tau subunit sfc1 n=1 Tax=Epichloe festucae (strain Fl1) TaxID=877507 RepID=A0A7S9KPQ5_EPIFF|nr:hypothetical protein C2857_005628 [Epichloe festucae Fl1]
MDSLLDDVELAGPSNSRSAQGPVDQDDGAPRYRIAHRHLSAIEIPAVVENVDRAVKAFGRVPTLAHALETTRNSIPLYLRPESPFCKPLMSHNAASHNVVLKVTVPKRTGRKRKKGSKGPWEGDVDISDASTAEGGGNNKGQVQSVARLDEPKVLRRKLEDNVGRYHVEAVGIIKHTHRFRALADFYWDMNRSNFAQRYVDQVLPGDVQNMKKFAFEGGRDRPPNVDILPPPIFTHMSLPFNYFYSQNPYVRTTEDGDTFNLTAVKHVGHFIGAEDPAPSGPQIAPNMTDPRMLEVMSDLEEAFQFRPIWTRRSLMNHLQGKLQSWNELKKYLSYTAYQFKGGPWRDSVVPYGLDPRTDPKYRIYQTLMFKLKKHRRTIKDQPWQFVRRDQMGASHVTPDVAPDSHMFDGEAYSTDGKVWQVCDITDPLLKELLDHAAVRPECDVNSGWYHGGLWAKVKAIMKTKLVAIQFGRRLGKEDFSSTLEYGDMTPTRSTSTTFHLPLPELDLTNEELTLLRGREPPKKKSKGYNARLRDAASTPAVEASEQSPPSTPTPFAGSGVVGGHGTLSEGDADADDTVSEDEEDDEFDNEGYEHDTRFRQAQEYGGQRYSHHHQQTDEEHDMDMDMDLDLDLGMGMGRTPYPELD